MAHPRPLYFLSRVGVVLRLWLGGALSTRQVVRLAMRVARFARWGVRPITQARFIALNQAASCSRPEDLAELARLRRAAPPDADRARALEAAEAALADTRAKAGRSAARELALQHAHDAALAKLAHLQTVAAAHAALNEDNGNLAAARAAATAGVQSFMDAFQAMLFAQPQTTAPSGLAASLVLGNRPPADALATLVNLSEPLHGARPFQYMLPFLAAPARFPLAWPEGMAALRIVDAGSRAPTAEHDMQASLRAIGPVETIGFDPFAPASDGVADDGRPVDLLTLGAKAAAHAVLAHAPALLARSLVCHVAVAFVPNDHGERPFAEIDVLMRGAGFGFVDFFSLGRQGFAAFDGAAARAFHRGRTLWAEAVYVRGLDAPEGLRAEELFRAAGVVHACYNKQDLAAELLGRADALGGTGWRDAYIAGLPGGALAGSPAA